MFGSCNCFMLVTDSRSCMPFALCREVQSLRVCAVCRDMTRPAVIKHSGMIIDPIQFNKSAADSAKQTKSKNNKKIKISVSAGIPRPSRR
jgi:hypothetical protein